MKIRLIGSTVGVNDGRQHLTSYLVNDRVAVDAGGLGFLSPLELQKQVTHVLLSHSHIDHLASLPIFLDNVYVPGPTCPTIHASQTTLDCLTGDIFNERIWPDVARISREESMFVRLQPIAAGQTLSLEGLRIEPVDVDHIVPTLGFFLSDDRDTILIVSDTGPTDQVWERANACPNLRMVFLECSFANSLEWLALKTKHLTPRLFGAELDKLRARVPVVAVHIKASQYDTVATELRALGRAEVIVGGADREWTF